MLWPPREGPGAPLAHPLTSADNAAAAVLEVGEGSVRALLTADVDSMVEESLAVSGPVAVLKVGHHGSASSTGSSRALGQPTSSAAGRAPSWSR